MKRSLVAAAAVTLPLTACSSTIMTKDPVRPAAPAPTGAPPGTCSDVAQTFQPLSLPPAGAALSDGILSAIQGRGRLQHKVASSAPSLQTPQEFLVDLLPQNPFLERVPMALTTHHLAVAARADRPQLVQLASAVIARRVADGDWRASWDTWLKPTLGNGTPPTPAYGRTP